MHPVRNPIGALLFATSLSLATPAVLAAPATAVTAAVPPTVDGKLTVNGVRYHYLLSKNKGPVVVLLHGWGTTVYMWRFVMPRLVAAGYTVLAPDLRGFGDTDKPQAGYDKASVARDIHALVTGLGLGPSAHIVGHDIGGMVAYAYAAQYRDETTTLTIMDVPLPGIAPWNEIQASERTWHFRFFGNRDIAERLVVGREKAFFSWFHNVEAVNTSAFTEEVEDLYARKYSAPGALRGGFEYYRAFPEDEVANRKFAETPLAMPVLAVAGAGGFPAIGEHLRHVANQVRTVLVEGSGHWVPEEQPEATTRALLDFLPRR